MSHKHEVHLGDVQETLFITLAGRADQAKRRKPLLDDPMAVRIVESVDYDTRKYGDWGDWITVVRTLTFDTWVRGFLTDHPHGTVVELGCGLNTRFERVDNGTVHWFDIDLPDTIELRSKFFSDNDRRTTIAASALDTDFHDAVAAAPGPYCFVAEGVFVYLPEDKVRAMLRRLGTRFPGALIGFDSYRPKMMRFQNNTAQKRNMPARWAWATDDPRSFTAQGLEIIDMGATTRPPAVVRSRLPIHYRLALRLLDVLLQGGGDLTLFRAGWRRPAT